ncbi:ferrichrome ABC transporter permease, partial [Bacillus nitratireducens]|uniref:ferrichrome ABC transporter permease n=1 Tax=Bacillus nitratireducens TaxID=2026193 RepID=UPI002850D937
MFSKKKKINTSIIAMIVIVVMLLPTNIGPIIEKYNTLYKTKEYYTVVNTIGQHIGDELYEYEFIAFVERGKEQKIKKTVKH